MDEEATDGDWELGGSTCWETGAVPTIGLEQACHASLGEGA